eukprot:SM000066S20463  [mRNA]  locus=s66:542337:545047:+ [translate_table: standard]
MALRRPLGLLPEGHAAAIVGLLQPQLAAAAAASPEPQDGERPREARRGGSNCGYKGLQMMAAVVPGGEEGLRRAESVVRRMRVAAFAVGEVVAVRCNRSKWHDAEVTRVSEEGVRLWVAAANAIVNVPVQLISSHLSKARHATATAKAQPAAGAAGMGRSAAPSPSIPIHHLDRVVRSPVHAIRPAHLSHRQLYRQVPTDDGCQECGSPLRRSSAAMSWECGHRCHFACVEARWRAGLTECPQCGGQSGGAEVGAEGLYRQLSSLSMASASSSGTAASPQDSNGGHACASSSSSISASFGTSSGTAGGGGGIPRFHCICSHACPVTLLEEDPAEGRLCCPHCQYNPWTSDLHKACGASLTGSTAVFPPMEAELGLRPVHEGSGGSVHHDWFRGATMVATARWHADELVLGQHTAQQAAATADGCDDFLSRRLHSTRDQFQVSPPALLSSPPGHPHIGNLSSGESGHHFSHTNSTCSSLSSVRSDLSGEVLMSLATEMETARQHLCRRQRLSRSEGGSKASSIGSGSPKAVLDYVHSPDGDSASPDSVDLGPGVSRSQRPDSYNGGSSGWGRHQPLPRTMSLDGDLSLLPGTVGSAQRLAAVAAREMGICIQQPAVLAAEQAAELAAATMQPPTMLPDWSAGGPWISVIKEGRDVSEWRRSSGPPFDGAAQSQQRQRSTK